MRGMKNLKHYHSQTIHDDDENKKAIKLYPYYQWAGGWSLQDIKHWTVHYPMCEIKYSDG